jgi:concanavalin A-like lectin/glucanase superfamily protein/PEP-CTERM motif-containing protein
VTTLNQDLTGGVSYVGDTASFNGTDGYIDTGLTFLTDSSGGFTFSSWFKVEPGSLPSDETSFLMGSMTGASNSNKTNRWLFIQSNGMLGSSFRDKTNGSNYSTQYGNTSVDDGVWHLATLVYDGSLGKHILYLDATAEATDNYIGTFEDVYSILIGAVDDSGGSCGGVDHYYGGLIDDARIYDNALSASDIQFLYDNTNPVPEPCTILLIGSGLMGLAGMRRRFRKG